ncbi:flagellin [Clostridium tyrobutyricum]|uniref:flagellin N-terminal helical domain-containing protein n=1 Tax=Clostridium tyrobutyricum TaxID=1519 RepID=UPI00073DA87D|nr:flagellin [Clostridium tyrobutyricum]
MIIAHNLISIGISNQLKKVNNIKSKSMEKLSCGLRINGASDDAAGLSISEKMKSQIRGLSQAERNVKDGISLIQTAEGGLNSILYPLQRMRKLTVQASNDTLTDVDRGQIQNEIEQIKDEIDGVAKSTTFNELKLLDGTYCGIDNIISTAKSSVVIGNKYISSSGLIVETGKNDSFEFLIGGATKNITLAAGNYSSLELLYEINNKLNLKNIDITASYSNGTYGELMFTSNTSGAASSIESISGNAAASMLLQKQYGNTTAFEVTGWTDIYPDVTITAGNNDTLTFDIDGINHSITISSGTYSTIKAGGESDLAQALNDAFTNAGLNIKTYIVGVQGNETDPKRVVDFEIYESEGIHTFGNVGGNARSTLMDKIEYPAWESIDSSGTVSGNCTGFPASITGNVNLSSGLTITEGVNDVLNLKVDGVWKSIMLNDGIYTSTSLLTEINDQLTASGANITASYSGNNLRLIHNENGIEHTIDDISGNSVSSLLINIEPGTDAIIEQGKDIKLQVGANALNNFSIKISDVRTSAIGISDINVSTRTGAQNAIDKIDYAINKVSSERSKIGSYQNSLEHIFNNVSNYYQNLTSSESKIEDTDMAKEVMETSKNSILEQVAESLLSQSNQMPNRVLDLLKQ